MGAHRSSVYSEYLDPFDLDLAPPATPTPMYYPMEV
ncbi:unnamed protein product, partial [Allacma fusca]